MKAIILAAGRGERLKPLTDTLPKPMIPIMGKPVLEYLILLCKTHGINEIAINTSYLPEKIREYFGTGKKWGVNLFFSYESELLGTSGALNNFKDFLKEGENFLVIYGDNVTDIDLTKMIEYHKSKGGIATLALRKKTMDLTSGGFVTVDENSQIKKIYEKSSTEAISELELQSFWKNSGIYLLNTNLIKYIQNGFSDFAKDIFPKLLEKGEKLFSYDMKGFYFREIGKIEKYELCKNELESKQFSLSYLNLEGRGKEQTIGNFNSLKNKAIFLDKEGVINENIYEVDGKLMAPATLEQIKILPKVKESIQKMKKMGFKIIVITNQPGVAFGYIDKEKLEEMIEYLKKELEIDEIYYCPHHVKYTGECDCRKPKIGMIKQAEKDFNLDLNNSYMVGDSLSDIKTGQNANVKKTFLVGIIREDILNIQHQKDIYPDYTLPDLDKISLEIEKDQ